MRAQPILDHLYTTTTIHLTRDDPPPRSTPLSASKSRFESLTQPPNPSFFFSATDNTQVGRHGAAAWPLDIRDSPAYHAYVALISGGDVNYNKNGYKALAKPYRQEIKFVAGNLMEVQLREIITKSVQTLGNFIKGFLTLEELKAVTGKPIRKIRPLVRTLSQTSSQAAEKADEGNRK